MPETKHLLGVFREEIERKTFNNIFLGILCPTALGDIKGNKYQ